MTTTSVRGLVRLIQVEVRDTSDLQPERAADLLNQLASLIGNCNDEIREADCAYAEVLLQHLDSEEASSRAKIRAEVSPEFKRKREARDTKELAETLIGTLKYFLRAKESEMRLSR